MYYKYSTNIKFSPPCPEVECPDCCPHTDVSWNYIWIQPVDCKIYMFASFSGDIYEYNTTRIRNPATEIAPGIEIGMEVFDDTSLSFPLNVPTYMNLGVTIYIKAFIKKSPDPNLIL